MKSEIRYGVVPNSLLLVNLFMALIYMAWWFNLSHIGNPFLYGLLFFGELYHVSMALGFWYTIWQRKNKLVKYDPTTFPSVAVFITVAGEPVEIVRETALAAKNMDYPDFHVFILNDGYVAGKENWHEIERMASEVGVSCITRKIGGGAKAGNINNALRQTRSDAIAILDADMIPHADFLKKLVPYFVDERVAFVQSPQYYKNFKVNNITAGAWEQQSFFFGPIMKGKDTINSAFICGTNVVIRRKALDDVGGINEQNIAEDFLTSLFIHKKKWRSVYVSDVLCEGLAPEDLLSYYKQQQRWARGSLEILFKFNPFFRRGLTFSQRFQYLLSALYYMNGLIVLIDALMPLIFLYTGLQPVSASTTSFALFFIPYMILNLYTLFLISGGDITFRAMSFSQASWILQLSALWSLLIGKKISFSVTAKQAEEGNFLFLIYPHLSYIFMAVVGVIYASFRFGSSPAVVTNTAWALFNIIMFLPFIKAAYQWENAPRNIIHYLFPKISVT